MESQPTNGRTSPTNNPNSNVQPLAPAQPTKISKSDFFILEKPNDPFKRLWCKSSKLFPKDLLSQPVLHKGQFVKLGKHLHFVNVRHYYLTRDYIYYRKVREWF